MWKTIVPPALFSVLLGVLSLTSLRQKGTTADECAHLPAGYTYVAFGDFRMNPEHPPLVKALSGLALLPLRPKVDTADPDWRQAREWAFGAKFLYEWNDADRLLFWGRVPVMLLTLLLGLAVYWCARNLYGWAAGCVALLLCLFNPDLLAHGQLVTTDLAVSLFIFLSVYLFYRALQRLTAANLLLFCLAVGLALITKFSAPLVFPMCLLVGAVWAFAGGPAVISLRRREEPRRVVSSRAGKLGVVAALLAAAGLAGLLIIWAAYGFRYAASPDPEVTRLIPWGEYLSRPGLLVDVARLARDWRLVPEAFVGGFLQVLRYADKRPAFLMGSYSSTGWWYYFLVTFLVKTPLPLMALMVLGLALTRRSGAGRVAEAMLLLPPGFYLAVSMTSNMNIGHRHLLPIYPFLIVFASQAGRLLEARWRAPGRERWPAVACALLLVWVAAEGLRIYPHYLAYFNQIAGGPANGYRWLVDSNLDWGQDLKGLAEYRRQHPAESFYLCYFGNDSPPYRRLQTRYLPGWPMGGYGGGGIKYESFNSVPPGATVAVSATFLQLPFLEQQKVPGAQKFMDRLRGRTPAAQIGYSINVYRLD